MDQAIARFDELVARYDGGSRESADARRRHYGRAARSVGKRLAGIGGALLALILATIVFSQVVGPIGLGGLFLVSLLTLIILGVFALWPSEPKRVQYNDQLPTRSLVRQLDSMLVARRSALPAPAARRVDEIGAQLPLLESRLEALDPLDPLAQDARRLMGKHLPELIERYEKVPEPYRRERDAEGRSVDERLVTSLDAAREAIDDIAARLAQSDRDAFETQGRFIESRYKESGGIGGQ
ncbi:MAG TPA: hypothetical protein VFQ67_01015 [Allosphingosinicella sp.]|nr:hypothetical protein [Allosphingosinicella sp.]